MDEFAKLNSQGVYCDSCGCYTGQELGHPTLCWGCSKEASDLEIENAIERGEEI